MVIKSFHVSRKVFAGLKQLINVENRCELAFLRSVLLARREMTDSPLSFSL